MKDPLDDSLDWTTPFESGSARGVSRRLTTWRPLSCCSLLLLLAVVAGFALQTCAQTGTTGGLEGVVLDPSGAYVAGATITLINQQTGRSNSVTSGTIALHVRRSHRRKCTDAGRSEFSTSEMGTCEL